MIDAIMLLAFGGPESMAEVRPFLSQVAAGVGIPESRLEEVALHYEHFDGFSPLNEQNRRLAKALSEALSARGHDLPVVLGNRNGKDRINETLGTLESEGKKLVLAVPTTPFASYSSCRQYMENVAAALEGMEISAVKMRHTSVLMVWLKPTPGSSLRCWKKKWSHPSPACYSPLIQYRLQVRKSTFASTLSWPIRSLPELPNC